MSENQPLSDFFGLLRYRKWQQKRAKYKQRNIFSFHLVSTLFIYAKYFHEITCIYAYFYFLLLEEYRKKMENIKLKRIASALLLDNEEQQVKAKAYFAEHDLNPVDINIEVQGVGPIDLPLTVSCIEKLVSVSSKPNMHEVGRENLRVTHREKII